MNNPFTAAAASFAEFRHMEMYNGLPAQLLHHLHPQFLHPGLPFGAGGAFRPLVELKTFQTPSAFAPPNRCLKISTSVNDNNDLIGSSHGQSTNHTITNIFSPSDNRNYSTQSHADSLSPVSVSMSPPLGSGQSRSGSEVIQGTSSSDTGSGNGGVSNDGSNSGGTDTVKQEHLDPQNSDGSAGSEHEQRNESGVNLRRDSVPTNQRMFRVDSLYGNNMPENGFNLTTNSQPDYTKSRFMFEPPVPMGGNKTEPSCCPVCGVCLQTGELESHFLQELESLCKLTCTRNNYEAQRLSAQSINSSAPDHRWEIFERIRNNRQDRLKSKLRKRKSDEVSCPICNRGMLRNSDELNAHISQCLRKQRMSSPTVIPDEDETVDIEGDSKGYVESSWPEDLRSPKSNSNIHFPRNATPSSTNMSVDQETEGDADDGEEEDLIVDADDLRVTTQYSPTPYSSDSEVVQSANSETQDRELLICSPDDAQQVNSTVNSSNDGTDTKTEPQNQQPCDSNVSTSDTGPTSRAELLKELKAKIRELENNPTADDEVSPQNETSNYKCLICMENYKNPVISTTCWHVHCEECWLQTLETRKKVCPQCNVVTSSSDLRRIFM